MPNVLEWLLVAKDQASDVFEQVGSSVEGQTKKFDKFKIGATVAVGAVAAASVAFADASIEKASDLNETINKASVIFGDQTKAMEKWASTASTSFGLSKAAALETAAGFGNMFSQLGFTGAASADMSQQVVKLAADLGSFNNLGTDEVIDKLEGAFRGEYDSLQALIPNINAARVSEEALAMTHKKSAKDVTEAEKAAAVLAIVQKDGAAAANDFAETSTGLANSQKILQASYEDVQASLGQKLLPIMTAVMAVGSKLIGWVANNTPLAFALAGAIGVLSAALMVAVHWETISASAIRIATAAQWLWNAALSANPISLIIIAIAALVAAVVLLWQRNEKFRQIVTAAWNAVKAAVKAVADWFTKTAMPALKRVFEVVWNFLKTMWNWSPYGIVINNWGKITGFFGTVRDRVVGAFRTAWDFLKRVWGWTPYGLIINNWDKILGFFKGLPGRVSRAVGGIWNGLWTGFRGVLNRVIGAWNNFHLTIGGGKIAGVSLPSVTLNTPNIPYLATGTPYAPGGLAMVGERGPELVSLPRGSRVYNAQQTARMSGPLDLSDATIARLAALILGGAATVTDDALARRVQQARRAAASKGLRGVAMGV